MICCGEERETAFCPDCGKSLRGCLTTLLTYCRNHEKTLKTHVDRLTADAQSGKRGGRLAETNRRHAKWKDWADALEALLKKKGG